MNTFNQVSLGFCKAFASLPLLIASGVAFSTMGQGIVYDQMSQGRTDSLSSVDVIPMFMPLGQVFVPQASRLDFVELRMEAASPGTPQVVKLFLRSGNELDDPVIASTDPVVMVFDSFPHPPRPIGVATFYFPETVSLVPGAP